MKTRMIIAAALMLLSVLPHFACNNDNKNLNSLTAENTQNDVGKKGGETRTEDANAFYFEESDGSIIITGLKAETETDIYVPDAINGMPVRAIKEYAFKNNKTLVNLTVPKSVENIGYGAFSGCSSLTSITLPFTGAEQKTEKGKKDYPFGYIFGTTPYTGGKSTMQFYHENSMDEVELVYYYIPQTLKEVKITGINSTHLPYSAFRNCSSINTITLGQDVLSVGEFAFSGVSGKIEWENPKITTIGEHSFEDYKGTSLIIPDSVVSIEKKAYSDCVNLKTITVPDSVREIDIYAFSYCYDLESIIIGKNTEKLSAETFYFCINLKNISLPEGLKTIEDGAFDSCKVLENISLPLSLTRINANAFKNCVKLKNVSFRDADGWRYYGLLSSGENFPADTLLNQATAAKYLTDTFCDYIWEKTPQ